MLYGISNLSGKRSDDARSSFATISYARGCPSSLATWPSAAFLFLALLRLRLRAFSYSCPVTGLESVTLSSWVGAGTVPHSSVLSYFLTFFFLGFLVTNSGDSAASSSLASSSSLTLKWLLHDIGSLKYYCTGLLGLLVIN